MNSTELDSILGLMFQSSLFNSSRAKKSSFYGIVAFNGEAYQEREIEHRIERRDKIISVFLLPTSFFGTPLRFVFHHVSLQDLARFKQFLAARSVPSKMRCDIDALQKVSNVNQCFVLGEILFRSTY